jgi:HEAT repeat protein
VTQRRIDAPASAFPALRAGFLAAAIALLAGGVTTMPAFAQAGDAADAKAQDNASLLADFIHYTRIQNYDLAEAMASELLGKGLANADFVALVEAGGDVTRFEETVQRAMRVTQLEKVAASMDSAFQKGQLERARNPEQIAKSISMLTGTDRGRRLAETRLVFAGEYAMPQLLEAFLDRSKPDRQAAVQRVIVGLGRQAVMPLCTALMSVSAVQQEQLADVLGAIPHRTSLPFLRELAESTSSDAVRQACRRSIGRLGADAAAPADAAGLYRGLAEAYYAERSDVTSFPGEDMQLLWAYQPGGGLAMTAIRTPVFHEAMAMRMAEQALRLEAASGGASSASLSLWVASNFSREIDAPEGYDNPAYPKARRSAEYFAVAAGPEVAQRVLARALADRDTPLARRAIAAVERTAGGKALWSDGSNGVAPLVSALTYPNRRVQFEAALALAAASPAEAFAGSDRVIPVLSSMVRGSTSQYAVILTADAELYQGIRSVLNTLGYTVLPQGRSMADLAAPISEAPAIDLVVTAGIRGDAIAAAINDVRGQSKSMATPTLVLTDATSYTDLRRRFAADATLAIRQAGIGEAAITESVNQLVERASGGPVSESEAAAYGARSLAALRDLSLSGNAVLNVSEATTSLVAALPQVKDDAQLRIAEILSRIDQDRAQRAVMEAALAAAGERRVAFLGLVGDSGKRFGNKLEAGQVSRLTEIAAKGADAEATAAAGLIGTLNLARTELVPMILEAK